MIIFDCRENANSAVLPETFSPLGPSAEVKAWHKVSPFDLTAKVIRFEDDLIPNRDALLPLMFHLIRKMNDLEQSGVVDGDAV